MPVYKNAVILIIITCNFFCYNSENAWVLKDPQSQSLYHNENVRRNIDQCMGKNEYSIFI